MSFIMISLILINIILLLINIIFISNKNNKHNLNCLRFYFYNSLTNEQHTYLLSIIDNTLVDSDFNKINDIFINLINDLDDISIKNDLLKVLNNLTK